MPVGTVPYLLFFDPLKQQLLFLLDVPRIRIRNRIEIKSRFLLCIHTKGRIRIRMQMKFHIPTDPHQKDKSDM